VSASDASFHPADLYRCSILEAMTARRFRPVLLLTLLCALLYLPGLSSIPPTDRDEARFMQATKQMIETGDYIHIRFQDEPRNKKPAGIHWLQSAAVKIAGQDLATFWPYRLPSAIAAWLAVLACFAFAARVTDRKTGLIAGAILATSFMVVIEAHIAKTDAALLAATTIAMGALATMYTRRNQESVSIAVALTFWLAIAAGALIKGPVSLAVAIATIVALAIADRDVRWLKQTRPLLGIPLVLALTLPWLLASSGGEGQNNFVVEAVRGDLIPKLIGGQESHGAPPGSHLAAMLITAWPWSLLVPFAAVFAWRRRQEAVIRFSLAWLAGTWLLFELVPTKLPHYTLPAFPALALLIAIALQSGGLSALMRTPAGRIYRGLWALVTLALGAGLIFAAQRYGDGGFAAAAIAVAVLAGGAALALSTWRETRPLALAVGAATGFAIILSAAVIPGLGALAVSSRLAAAIAPHRMDMNTPIPLAGYSEPSAVFLLGTNTILTGTESVIDRLVSAPGSVGVIEAKETDAVSRSLEAKGARLRTLADVKGYNYSRGDEVALSIITASQPEPSP